MTVWLRGKPLREITTILKEISPTLGRSFMTHINEFIEKANG